MSIKLLVADDHEMVRRGLASLLKDSNIKIVGEADNGEQAVSKTFSTKPDVVLMDIRMPALDGIDALAKIRVKMPNVPVVMLSAYDNPTYIARSAALGACDFVLKGSGKQELIAAITRASKSEAPPEKGDFRRVKSTMEKKKDENDKDNPLTNREMQVLRHVALGLSNREIGKALGISVETVKEHVQNILRKIEATDRTQAAVWAVRKGYV